MDKTNTKQKKAMIIVVCCRFYGMNNLGSVVNTKKRFILQLANTVKIKCLLINGGYGKVVLWR